MVSYESNGKPCGLGGQSWLYILNGCDGSMSSASWEGDFVKPLQVRGKLDKTPMVIKPMTKSSVDLLLVGDHDGSIHEIEFQGESLGKVYWRQNGQR